MTYYVTGVIFLDTKKPHDNFEKDVLDDFIANAPKFTDEEMGMDYMVSVREGFNTVNDFGIQAQTQGFLIVGGTLEAKSSQDIWDEWLHILDYIKEKYTLLHSSFGITNNK